MPLAIGDQDAAYANFSKNAIGSLPASMLLGNLDNDVHLLFQQASFYVDNGNDLIEDIDSHSFHAILPILRLASLLITELAMLEVFDRVAHRFVTCNAHGDLYIAKGSLERTALSHEYARQVFLKLDPDVQSTFFTDKSRNMSRRVHASTIVLDPTLSMRPRIKRTWLSTC
jgi:hypothetical protein